MRNRLARHPRRDHSPASRPPPVAAPAGGGRPGPGPSVGTMAGVNDWSCTPTKAHPSPVVIVHGTFGDSRSLLGRLASDLKHAGYCVFSLDYGNRATGPDRAVGGPAEDVRGPRPGRDRRRQGVDGRPLAGRDDAPLLHPVPRWSGQGRRPRRARAVQPRHLQPAAAHARLSYLCPSCLQQKTGSAFLQRLNAGDETPGPVSYTNVVTRYDEVVIPHTSGFLSGDAHHQRPAAGPLPARPRPSTSGSRWTVRRSGGPLNALGRPGPADPAYRPSCLP